MVNFTNSPLATRRNEKGMNQSGLGLLCGTSKSYISSIENGHWLPGLAMSGRLAAALDCSIDDIAIDLGVDVEALAVEMQRAS